MTQPDTTWATGIDLQELETRVDGRFQAVNARFIAVGGRFATLGDRLNGIIERLGAVDRSTTARCDKIDGIIDEAQAQLERVQADLTAAIDHAYRTFRRVLILGLLGITFTTGVLCVSIVLLTM